jgi:hypothetical protein
LVIVVDSIRFQLPITQLPISATTDRFGDLAHRMLAVHAFALALLAQVVIWTHRALVAAANHWAIAAIADNAKVDLWRVTLTLSLLALTAAGRCFSRHINLDNFTKLLFIISNIYVNWVFKSYVNCYGVSSYD